MSSQDNDQETIRIAFRRRILTQIVIFALTILVVIGFFVFISGVDPEEVEPGVPIPGTGYFATYVIVAAIVSVYTWRCPVCKRWLGRRVYPRTCPRCGVQLR
jgi:hypothetical protein